MEMPRRRVWSLGIRRAGFAFAVAALLALPAVGARAGDDATQVGSYWLTGNFEVGGRGSWANGDKSVFQNYRDLSTGPFSNFDLLFEDADHLHFLEGSGWNVGYDNQRYELGMGRWGHYKLDLFYGELPVQRSKGASTLFFRNNGNQLLLPPGVQSTIAGAGSTAAQAAALQSFLGNPVSTDLRYRWLQGGAKADVHLGENLDFHAGYRIQDKEGSRPFAMGFGNPGGTFIQLPAPINEKIHTIDAGVDWLFHGVALRFDYDGSLFVNDYDSVTAANPLVATSVSGGASSLGRASLAPDNQAHSFSLSASASLPLNFSNRVTSSFVYQLRYQDSRFMPVTVNSLTPTMAPSQNSLNGWVDAYLGNILATARPTKDLGLKFRYRIYDFNNRSSNLTVPTHVVNDTGAAVVEDFHNIHESFQRQNAELSGSYDLTKELTGTLGVNWEHWSRSSDREVHGLNEYGPTAKLDWKPFTGGLFRLDYSYRKRQGSDYGTYNYLKKQLGTAEALADAPTSQSSYLRKFDEANRDSHDFGVMARFEPTEATELTFNGGYTYEDYYNTTLGLVTSQGWNTGADFAWAVNSWLRMSAFYTYENSLWKQNQQWRPRNFAPPITVVNDPLNNWFSNTTDQYQNAGFRVDFEIIPDRLDGEIGYIFNYGQSKQRGSGVPGFVGTGGPGVGSDGGNAVNWPTITSTLHAFTGTLNYHLSKRLTVKFQYRYENYSINNFTQNNSTYLANSNINGSGTVSPSLNVFLGDGVGDYQAHIFGLSAIYHF